MINFTKVKTQFVYNSEFKGKCNRRITRPNFALTINLFFFSFHFNFNTPFKFLLTNQPYFLSATSWFTPARSPKPTDAWPTLLARKNHTGLASFKFVFS